MFDTGDCHPRRDGAVDAVDDGQVESEWVSGQLGRPVAEAWNAVLAGVFADAAPGHGDPERIAAPVAASDPRSGEIARSLVEDTGFDAMDSGSLAESWRQQPASPAYGTSLSVPELE